MTARTDDEVARIMSFGPPADVMDAVSALMLDVSLCVSCTVEHCTECTVWKDTAQRWDTPLTVHFPASHSAPTHRPQDYSEEVWVLGRSYLLSDHDPGQRARFAADVRSRLWMSYRRGFEPIAYTSLQADSGWGCMLRCGQMMLAQAFVQQQLGDDWETSPRGNSVKRGILRWFGDAPSCPFSIHRIAERGAIIGKRVGEWFGPNAMAQVMKSLVADNASPCNLSVYIAMDGQLAKEAAGESMVGVARYPSLRIACCTQEARWLAILACMRGGRRGSPLPGPELFRRSAGPRATSRRRPPPLAWCMTDVRGATCAVHHAAQRRPPPRAGRCPGPPCCS